VNCWCVVRDGSGGSRRGSDPFDASLDDASLTELRNAVKQGAQSDQLR
jgi:hypothetical protein